MRALQPPAVRSRQFALEGLGEVVARDWDLGSELRVGLE